jgi:hypothetical protein
MTPCASPSSSSRARPLVPDERTDAVKKLPELLIKLRCSSGHSSRCRGIVGTAMMRYDSAIPVIHEVVCG